MNLPRMRPLHSYAMPTAGPTCVPMTGLTGKTSTACPTKGSMTLRAQSSARSLVADVVNRHALETVRLDILRERLNDAIERLFARSHLRERGSLALGDGQDGRELNEGCRARPQLSRCGLPP